jgi:hypothetical protein
MVNGIFLHGAPWENFAGQTWSMIRYCRPGDCRNFVQLVEKQSLFEMARLSLFIR